MTIRCDLSSAVRVVVCAAVVGTGLILGGLANAQPADATYMGVSQCKICHNKPSTGAQYTVWKGMMHSKALETLKGDEAKKIAEEKGLTVPAYEAPECLKCHVTAYDVEKKAVPEKIDMAEGVQCEACHGPASAHIATAKKVLFQKDEAAKAELPNTIGHPDAKTCEKCHNSENPTWNPERYTLKDGTKVGFDFEQAYKKIAHPDPELHKEEAPAASS